MTPEPTETLVRDFHRDGYLVLPGLGDAALCRALNADVDIALDPPLGPLELEAELGYPGAPSGLDVHGGQTPRRLLHAYSRGPVYRDWARSEAVTRWVSALLDDQYIALVQAHHNCVMTKYPLYGSETGWHQDIRYWSFASPDLVNVWLALGPEDRRNGGMRVIPGSHRLELGPERFDEATFFGTDHPQNRALIGRAVDVELASGDVLLFHCRLLHAAGRNQSEQVKRSLVFTYNRRSNEPVPGSRSARLSQIPL